MANLQVMSLERRSRSHGPPRVANATAAASTAAAAARNGYRSATHLEEEDEEPPQRNKKTKTTHIQQQQDDDKGSSDNDEEDGDNQSSASVSHSSRLAQSDSHNESLRDLRDTGRHFSKIASRFIFLDNTASYQNWYIQFRAEMDNYALADVLTTDPAVLIESAAESDAPVALSLLGARQKTVYHMLLQCVPTDRKAVVITSLPESDRTGYGAWCALRKFYIGDEQAYLQSLETKFINLRWQDTESFPSFQTRYESLLSELEAAGVGKLDHVKRMSLMNASGNEIIADIFTKTLLPRNFIKLRNQLVRNRLE